MSQIIINKSASLAAPTPRAAASVRVPLGMHKTPRNGFEFGDMPRIHAAPRYSIADYAAMLDYIIDCGDAVAVSNGVTVRQALRETLNSEACHGWRVLPRHIDQMEQFIVTRIHRAKAGA